MKKILSTLLAAMMVFSAAPTNVFAADDTAAPVKAAQRTEKLNLNIISDAAQGAAVSDGVYTNTAEGWKWDSASKTLTLSGAQIDVKGDGDLYALIVPDGSTMVLEGTNSVSINDDAYIVSAVLCGAIGMDKNGYFSIDGEGAADGALTILGSGTLNIKAAGKEGVQAIRGSGFTIGDDNNTPKVDIDSRGATGLLVSGGDLIMNNGTLISTTTASSKTYDNCAGIQFVGEGKAELNGGKTFLYGNKAYRSFGIWGSNLTINGGTLNALSDENIKVDSDSMSSPLHCNSITIADSVPTITPADGVEFDGKDLVGKGGVALREVALGVGAPAKFPPELITRTGTTAGTPSGTFQYKVQKDDYLNMLATRFSCTVEEILALNKFIDNRNLIFPGQMLNIPDKGNNNVVAAAAAAGNKLYTVKSGDTLGNIAAANKCTVAEIMSLNASIKDKNLIYPGQTLTIPKR